MNRNCYQLVFNTTLGMMVPTAETARRRGKAASGPALALAGVLLAGAAQAELPVPSAGGSIPAFVTSGAANYATSGAAGFVTQTTPKAILNWQSYNVGAGNTLTYRFQDGAGNLPAGASFSTLNRIWQGSPSEIAGRIQVQPGQNGQITLINQNGIIFRDGAQINVGSLTASSLDISDSLFSAGIASNLMADMVAAFAGTAGGLVKVDAGAELKTETGGRVLLLAPNVENHGLITTPEGQTILAAGSKVYLAVSDDPRLRGFLVEVDNGGAATNSGRIIAERGNVSMAGLAVNQLGRVNATTSVSLNGSIRLLARDTVGSYDPPATLERPEPRKIPLGTNTGALVFGAGSVTEVTPDTADSAASPDQQAFNRSRIEGVGRTIHVRGDSLLRAQGGEIALDAQAGQMFQSPGDGKVAGVRLQVDTGALLDVSGLSEVPVSVERNYIQAELRGEQLKDAPLQRDSFLRNSKVWVDIEQGTPLADVSGYIAQVGRTVAEKSAVGGNVTLRSEGDLVLQPGARVDVSGGSIAYQGGFGRTTQLVDSSGKIVDIGQADPERVYSGFASQYTVKNTKWGVTDTYDLSQREYVPGYTQGRDAGTLTLVAHGLANDASLRGQVVAGTRQRSAPPRAGRLVLGDASTAAISLAAFKLPEVRFAASTGNGMIGFGDALPAATTLTTDFLTRGGFGGVAVYSEGRISVPRDIAIDAGTRGSITLHGNRLDIDGDLYAAGGSIALRTSASASNPSTDAADYAVRIGPNATLSTRGQWVNDLPGMGGGMGAVAINGGTLTLASIADLDLQAGSVLDVGGGAWAQADGKLRYGNAGTIALSSGRFGLSNASDPQTSRIRLDGSLRGDAPGNGGRLTINASSVTLGAAGSGAAGELVLGEEFFGAGGFKDFDIGGADGVTVADGFMLRPRPQTQVLDGRFRLAASGSDMRGFSSLQRLDADQRQPASVKLRATNAFNGALHVGEGAAIEVDPQGSISLSAAQQLTVLGRLAARAGSISLSQPVANPAPTGPDNFSASRAIWLGANSRLDAGGHYRARANVNGLREGQVLDGGSVSINAAKGYLVMQPGASIDVSGTRATLDLPAAGGLRAVEVGSQGGGIALSAREGMLLEGSFAAHAGNAQAQGGSLSVRLSHDRQPWGDALPASSPVQRPRAITLQAAPTALSAGMTPGAALDAGSLNGEARLAQSQVRDGGFVNLTLDSDHRIRFDGALDLGLAGRLALYAPNFSAASGATRARLAAASIILGNRDSTRQEDLLRNDASGGTATLGLTAGLIDLIGHSSVQGFGNLALASHGDIRARSVVYKNTNSVAGERGFLDSGSLASGGDIHLTARQIYPASMASFSIEVQNNPAGRIRIDAAGAPGPVLSAGGSLRLAAPHIEQNGTLKAPFGEIALASEAVSRITSRLGDDGLPAETVLSRTQAAGGSVTLGAGSLVSVSGEGRTIPLGNTELSGRDWVFDLGNFKYVLATPPEKRVRLDGDSVNVAAGARIDLSGGGDLYAYEFLPGPGGSRDILAAGNSQGLYAVLPDLNSRFSPYDAAIFKDLPDWNPGASVRLLEGAHGLAAGDYALLPARYTLLPGAYLVRMSQADSDLLPGARQQLPNGAVRVAGHMGSAAADGGVMHGARTATIEVQPGSAARRYSQFLDTRASVKYANVAAAQQPGDAGRLSIAAGASLNLAGSLSAAAERGRRGAEVDISALKLAVTADGAGYAPGYVSLDARQLNSLGAASLLLGGARSIDAKGDRQNVAQKSDELAIAAGARLAAPELLLTARDTLRLDAGSEVAGQGEFSGRAKDIHLADAGNEGDGALLRVSTGDQVALTRAPASRVRGTLDVREGAVVRAGKSAILDASFDHRNRGQIVLPASGGALTLGATRISLAQNGIPVTADGLVFDQDALGLLGDPAQLKLRSYSTLDLYGDVDLGSTTLRNLDIEAAGLAGYAAAGKTAVLRADRVGLANPDGIDPAAAFGAAATGRGDLDVRAQTIALGKGELVLRGFETARLNAADQLIGQGGKLKVESGSAAGNLDVNAGRITVAAGADQAIEAAGALTTRGLAAPAAPSAMPLGGMLTLTGSRVTHGGRIDMPAGRVILRSTGSAPGDDVRLLDGSAIRAGGATLAFADTQAHAPGGLVSLRSAGGKVIQESGALIDVAGDGAGGDAGELRVAAAADAELLGTLRGGAQAGFESGRFRIDAKRINPDAGGVNGFSSLNAALQAGGFHQSRQLRVRQGDVEIAAGDTARAREFVLSVDGGKLDVAGVIDASGAQGGRIDLYADGDLNLLGGARLLAQATESRASAWGTAGEGGQVVLGSTAGRVKPEAGALIDVSTPAGSAARGGTVLLRAARDGNDVKIDPVLSTISGARSVAVEAVRVYDNIDTLTASGGSGTTLSLATIDTDNTAFAAHHAAIKARLGRPDLRILSGVEVRSAGNLTLGSDWNLLSHRPGGEPGVLSLRAAGNLNIDNSLSDGFATAAASGALQSAPASWSYRLAAGADRAAADPLATGSAGGTLTVAADKRVRTGSGDIAAVAAGDIELKNGAALYTAGYATPAVAGFATTGLPAGFAFPTGGGSVRVRADGSVVSATGPDGLVTDWLYRQGNTTTPNSVQFRAPGWWPQIAAFRNGIGALGGGNVEIGAGDKVSNLLAATVTNARQPASFGTPVDASRQVIQGGGDLTVRADGDIAGGVFFVDRGTGRIAAGGALGEGVARGDKPIGAVLALGDAGAAVSARQHLALESVVNPSLLPQSAGNLGGTGGANRESWFVSTQPDSAARLSSIAGDLRLANDPGRLVGPFNLDERFISGATLYPGSLDAAALQGNLLIDGGMTLLPSPQGQLRLLAGKSVEASGTVNLSDRAPGSLPGLQSPSRGFSAVQEMGLALSRGAEAHAPVPVHQFDMQPAYVVARQGDIVGKALNAPFAVLPKAAVFEAGRDIRKVTVIGQNLRETDATRFVAGRDLVFSAERDANGFLGSVSDSTIEIGGPGRVSVLASRHVDLGMSKGIVTRGNLNNPFLPEGGASLLVAAGATGVDAAGNARPVNPALLGDAAVQTFFGKLQDAAKRPDGQYEAGLAAIAGLFPGADPDGVPLQYQGDISLFFSQIKTEQGGAIRMLAPGGQVNAGLASVTGFARPAADLGVMTVRGGDIQTYSRGDFLVNSSRVFTISGGDVLMWSSEGNIDAGKGAKTAVATPPPQLRIDNKGNFVLDVSQSIAGSGIGALKSGSNATLVAPKGEVNAGDAGIRAGGDLILRANVVVGADNIQVGGASSGVPIADAGALGGAGISGVGDVGGASSAVAALSQNLSEAARAADELKKSLKPTFITAEVIGFGD